MGNHQKIPDVKVADLPARFWLYHSNHQRCR